MDTGMFNEVLQRLATIEAKLDNIENVKKDVEDVRLEVSDLKGEVNLLKAKDEIKSKEIEELKAKNKKAIEIIIGELVAIGTAIVLGCIKMGIGV